MWLKLLLLRQQRTTRPNKFYNTLSGLPPWWWLMRGSKANIITRSPGTDGFTSPPKDVVKHLLIIVGGAESTLQQMEFWRKKRPDTWSLAGLELANSWLGGQALTSRPKCPHSQASEIETACGMYVVFFLKIFPAHSTAFCTAWRYWLSTCPHAAWRSYRPNVRWVVGGHTKHVTTHMRNKVVAAQTMM